MNEATSSGVHAARKSPSIRKTGSRVTAPHVGSSLETTYSHHSASVPTTSTGPIKIQNTHWYRSGFGCSANPHTAPESEIRRVGLHSCTGKNCAETHAWSAEEYYRLQILKQWAEEGHY